MKILSARRAYEFAQDGLRLKALSTPRLEDVYKMRSSLRRIRLVLPLPRYRTVPITYPPGAVFDTGALVGPPFTPIRFLHIEPRRIVIDVWSKSSTIDTVFARLLSVVDDLPPELRAIDDPIRVRDRSEILVDGELRIEAIFRNEIVASVKETLADAEISEVVPGISVWPVRPSDDGFQAHGDPDVFALEVRAGTAVSDHQLFSAAPLTTEGHATYLRRLLPILGIQIASHGASSQ